MPCCTRATRHRQVLQTLEVAYRTVSALQTKPRPASIGTLDSGTVLPPCVSLLSRSTARELLCATLRLHLPSGVHSYPIPPQHTALPTLPRLSLDYEQRTSPAGRLSCSKTSCTCQYPDIDCRLSFLALFAGSGLPKT